MTDDDFMKFSKKFEEVVGKRKDEDYQINEENWKKFVTVTEYLDNKARELGGSLMPVALIPKEQHGFIEAEFDVFVIRKGFIEDFTKAIRLVDVFSIEPTTDDKVRIGVNINYVYEKIR